MNKLQKNLSDFSKRAKRLYSKKVMTKIPAGIVALIAFVSIPFALAAMGKILFASAVKTAILYQFGFNGKVSGRMDGNVLMRNGRGRGMTVPALVRNSYTSLQRGFFSSFSSGWRGLSDAERLSWINLKLNTSDRFGMAKTVSGKEAYIALNQNLANIGGAPLASAPLLIGVGDQILSNGAIDFSADTYSYDVNAVSLTTKQLLFATAPLSAGISRPGLSEFRLLGQQPAPVALAVDFKAEYQAKFGVAPAGSKVFIFTRDISITSGEAAAGSNILTITVVP